jgi:hypothetical protein
MNTLGDVAIMGGGCYGTFYLQQLVAARAKGSIAFRRLLIVDHDLVCQASASLTEPGCELVCSAWDAFLDAFLDPDARRSDDLDDMIVPTPLMPHLMAHWLERRAQLRWPQRDVRLVPVERAVGTPYDRLHTDGVRYVSFADWLCPTHCVEPLLCPAIRAPRTWEMGDAISAWSEAEGGPGTVPAPALFTCRHVAHGVGMYRAAAAQEAFTAFEPFADSPDGAELPIGSISACHGAIALLRVGPESRGAS